MQLSHSLVPNWLLALLIIIGMLGTAAIGVLAVERGLPSQPPAIQQSQ